MSHNGIGTHDDPAIDQGSIVNGEHTSSPQFGPSSLWENGGFHGMAGNKSGVGNRSRTDRRWGVVRGPFIGNPPAGLSTGGGLERDGSR